MGLNSRGKIDFLVVIALIIVIISATTILMGPPNKPKYSFNVHNSMTVIKQNLFIHMDDPEGWGYTLADSANASFQCINAHTNCVAYNNVATPVKKILDVAGNTYLTDLDSDTQGVGLDGKPCSGFDPGNGNPGCPIKISINWKASCGTLVPCIDPPYTVEVKFTYSVPIDYGPRVDISKYNFVLTKP
jgi:hypothetical protein